MKSVTAKFTAEELVTKREVVKLQIQQSLIAYINNTLKEKGVEKAIEENPANLALSIQFLTGVQPCDRVKGAGGAHARRRRTKSSSG